MTRIVLAALASAGGLLAPGFVIRSAGAEKPAALKVESRTNKVLSRTSSGSDLFLCGPARADVVIASGRRVAFNHGKCGSDNGAFTVSLGTPWIPAKSTSI